MTSSCIRSLPRPPALPHLLLLDCDGVIFDTNRAKSNAFRAALSGYPSHVVEAFMEHHVSHGGVSRYAKVERLFRELYVVPEAERDARTHEVLESYGRASRQAYLDTGPRREAFELIRLVGSPPTYVVSGSDQAELREVFELLGISKRFTDVLGSPTPKLELVHRVLARESVEAGDCLYVGDGRADVDVALELDIPFIFLAEMAEWSPSPSLISNERIWYASTWEQLLEYLR